MALDFTIPELFELLFGYRSTAFDPEFDKMPGRKVEGAHRAPYYAIDANGQEYYLPVIVNVGTDRIPGTQTSYAEYLGRKNQDGSYNGEWYLPYPVVSVRSNKTIIDTPLTERQGVVSELININGFSFTIKGLMIGQNGEFPEEDYATIHRLYKIGKPIRITNVITDVHLVDADRAGSLEVTIRDLDCPGIPGVGHVRGYSMTMTSNEPFNLIDIS
jgi:hypothetical protein